MTYYTKAQLPYSDIGDQDLLNTLKSSWGFEPDESMEVICELKGKDTFEGSTHYRVYNVKSIKDMRILQYPISGIEERDDIPNNGIYVKPYFDDNLKNFLKNNQKVLVTCNLLNFRT